MRREGLTVVELLLAAAVGALVLTAGFLTVRKEAKNLVAERAIALSHDQAARALQGLSGELKDRPIAFVLPGANERGATLVTLAGRGAYVPRDGYEPDTNKLPVLAEEEAVPARPPLGPGLRHGEALYVPALARVAGGGPQHGGLGAGPRESAPTPSSGRGTCGPTRRRPSRWKWTLILAASGSRARPSRVPAGPGPEGLRLPLRVRRGGRGAGLPGLPGASLPDGSRLVALAFMSVSGGRPAGPSPPGSPWRARAPCG